ncbi:MAG: DUF4159 domain-containing protein [Proteobacteria bacterium]|nr:DUF4159 domain-containing protein [Pseudomonadota bacterium]
MNFGNLMLTPTWTVLAASALALIGLVLWWLLRKRQQRVWLPTVRILRLEAHLLPQLVLRPPPLLAFLCFVVCALALLGLTLRPRTQIYTPFEPNQTHLHLFCDLSPSVSAQLGLEEYAERIAVLYDTLQKQGRVSLSTSHSPEVVQPKSADEVRQLVLQRGFHRSGLNLGNAMKELLKETTDIDRLFIVSDRDQHSWTGFNWRYLLEEMDVQFYDLSKEGRSGRSNIFINDARYLSTAEAQTMEWDVEIGRGGSSDDTSGTIEAVYMGRSLGSFAWRLPEGKQRLNVHLSWPVQAVAGVSAQDAQGIPLILRLHPGSGDGVALDDEFRTPLKGLKQDVILIGESSGERLLEDPAEQLEVALEIQGFRIKRYDFISGVGPKTLEAPLIVLLGGGGAGVDRFCPRSLATMRLAHQGDGRSLAGERLPKIWLAPQGEAADYRELCRCYTRLLLTPDAAAPEPSYCDSIESRSQWVGLLPSLGAKQVGGSVGNAAHTLAFHQRDQRSGLEILAFTVPLAPTPGSGINHAQMPILVKELIAWQGLTHGQGTQGGQWPRTGDIVQALWNHLPPLDAEALAQLRVSNVPLGESLLGEVDLQSLPPRWAAELRSSSKQLPSKKDREDPLPWLRLAAYLCIGAGFLEGIVALSVRLRSVLKAGVGVVLMLTLLHGGKAEARIEFNVLGSGLVEGTNFSTLAREVGRRTSIELAAKPELFTKLSPEALAEPWLWTSGSGAVANQSGELKTEVATWLRRGGFLIIEAPWQPLQLNKLTRPLNGSWQPLPPDHEVMRSFYLLDALPSCNGEIWRGYSFDGRLAILAVPYGFLDALKDHGAVPACKDPPDQERGTRVFINLIMVALATDYKRDQIHLPEILKRLR